MGSLPHGDFSVGPLKAFGLCRDARANGGKRGTDGKNSKGAYELFSAIYVVLILDRGVAAFGLGVSFNL